MKLETSLMGRKIAMFRAHYDPMIGPTTKNAFNLMDPNIKMEGEYTENGIYVKVLIQETNKLTGKKFFPEHLVPFANIQSIKLMPIDEEKEQ